MATISITVAGKDEFNRVFLRHDAAFEDLSPIWPSVRDQFFEFEKEQFGSEGSAGRSGAWKPLSPQYNIQKIKQFGNKPILVATGRLKASLMNQSSDSVYRTTKTEIAIGTALKYGLFHQLGTSRMPKREPISFSEQQRKKLGRTIHFGLMKILKKR